jgi:hypothetical protein
MKSVSYLPSVTSTNIFFLFCYDQDLFSLYHLSNSTTRDLLLNNKVAEAVLKAPSYDKQSARVALNERI